MNVMTLTDEEMQDRAKIMGESVFKFYKKSFLKELDYITSKHKALEMDINEVIYIAMASLFYMDASVFFMLKGSFKNLTKNEIDMVELINLYIDNIMDILTEDEIKRLKKKMKGNEHDDDNQ